MVERRSDRMNFNPEKHLSTDTWNTKVVTTYSTFYEVKKIINDMWETSLMENENNECINDEQIITVNFEGTYVK